MLRPASETELEPVIISMGTSRALRIRKVGAVYFIENLNVRRGFDPTTGVETAEDEWKGVAVAKGKDARREAHEWLAEANVKVLKMMLADTARGSRA